MTLDDIDLKILDMLQKDGRISHAAIGKAVGLTGPSVYARVQRLEQENVIRGYTSLLDARAVNLNLTAFIRISARGGPADTGDFTDYMLGDPRVVEFHEVAGEDSFIAKVRVESLDALKEMLGHILNFPAIARTVTSISLATYKEKTDLPLTHVNSTGGLG